MAVHQEVKKQAQRRNVATAETLYPILFQPRFGAGVPTCGQAASLSPSA